MLVIFSDVHLTDGTTAENVRPEAFSDLLLPEIEDNAKMKQAGEVHVVLLGDIFDLVRTSYWHEAVDWDDRPWNDELDPKTGMNKNSRLIERQFSDVLDRILNTDSGKAFMKLMKELPARTNKNVKVTYIIGNHDRVFNNFQSLQQKLRDELRNINLEFRNELRAPEYGVIARHGHEWDDHCHGWHFAKKVLHKNNGHALKQFDADTYKIMTIGEVVTAELMSGLICEMAKSMQEKDWNTEEDQELLDNLKNLNNIRPLEEAIYWLNWFMKQRFPQKAENGRKELLLDAIQTAVSNVLKSAFAKQWDKSELNFLLIDGDLTDKLQKVKWGLNLLNYNGLHWLIDFWHDVKHFLPRKADKFLNGAKTEWENAAFKNDRRFQYVVYGHTHEARQEYLEANGDEKVKMYINSGTFLPLIQPAHRRNGFASAHRMTIANFFKDDEDMEGRKGNGPTLTLWNGIKRKTYTTDTSKRTAR